MENKKPKNNYMKSILVGYIIIVLLSIIIGHNGLLESFIMVAVFFLAGAVLYGLMHLFGFDGGEDTSDSIPSYLDKLLH